MMNYYLHCVYVNGKLLNFKIKKQIRRAKERVGESIIRTKRRIEEIRRKYKINRKTNKRIAKVNWIAQRINCKNTRWYQTNKWRDN